VLYQDITGKILNASFSVINELGSGFLESVYEKALLVALRKQGLEAEAQVPVDVLFQGENIGKFYADILVEGKVIIELKTVSKLAPEHQAQVINYLKATGIKVGMLINFGNPTLEYRRLSLRTKLEANAAFKES
jgi:GxxExxY protein